MTKLELIKALNSVPDDIQIAIYKNGTIFPAFSFLYSRKETLGGSVVVIHNYAPDLHNITEIK